MNWISNCVSPWPTTWPIPTYLLSWLCYCVSSTRSRPKLLITPNLKFWCPIIIRGFSLLVLHFIWLWTLSFINPTHNIVRLSSWLLSRVGPCFPFKDVWSLFRIIFWANWLLHWIYWCGQMMTLAPRSSKSVEYVDLLLIWIACLCKDEESYGRLTCKCAVIETYFRLKVSVSNYIPQIILKIGFRDLLWRLSSELIMILNS